MKKVLTLLCVFIIVGLTACSYKGYSGVHSDLFTVAINSVLWNNGHSFSADKYKNPQIQIIEEDMYGRTMFTYYEKYYAGAYISFSALIICQNSNENEVFYYEDICYIIKEQVLYTQIIEEFENEDVEQLKEANDWNQEINYDKCIKKQITNQKHKIPYENEVKNEIVKEFDLNIREDNLFVNILTSNLDNSKFIIYGYIHKLKDEEIVFVGLVQNCEKSLNINFFIPSNIYDYKNDFIKFKQMNQW